MSPETFFLLYAVQQHWLTETQAEELWQAAEDDEDQRGIDEVALEMKLLDEKQVKQGREVVGLDLTAELLPHVGDYDIVECIGRGRHGVVFRAQPELHSDNVAVKVLVPRLLDDLLYLENFTQRVEALHKQEIENAATTLESGEDDGHHFLVSEYVDGTSLAQKVKDDGPVTEEQALNIATHLARALVHAEEKNIAHLGISPRDIMLMPEGDALLLDLGLAKEVYDKVLLQFAFSVGVEHYYAPEQAGGEKGDIRTDIFSLGSSIYYAITGRPPFAGRNSSAIVIEGQRLRTISSPKNYRPELSKGFCEMLNRMMARLVEDRYQTASDLVADLESLAEGKWPEDAAIDDIKTILESTPETTEVAAATEDITEMESKETVAVGPAADDDEEEEDADPITIEEPDDLEPTTGETRRVEIPPTRRVPAIDGPKEKERRRSTGLKRGVKRKRGEAMAKKKSIAPILGFAIPAVLVIIALIFIIARKNPEKKKKKSSKGPPITKLAPHLQKLEKEYKSLQKYMTPDQLETARKKLKEHIENVKNYPPLLRRARASLKQISKLEEKHYAQQKEKLKSAVPPRNLVLNGGFEDGDEDGARYWELKGKGGGWVDEDPATGKHCLGVWGAGRARPSYWSGAASPIDAMQPYKVSFKLRTELWRRDSNAYISIGYYRRIIEPKTKWTEVEFIFVPPTLTDDMIPYDEEGQASPQRVEVRLGISGRQTKMYFDDLRIVKAKPWNKRIIGVTLGAGEKIQNNGYEFRMTMGSKVAVDKANTNYSRCLQNFSASGSERGWDLAADRYVLYAHEIDQFTQKERGLLSFRTERHAKTGATLKVEASNDFAEWSVLKTLDEPNSASVTLPKELLPAGTLYVRFTATAPCQLTYYTYKVSLEHKETPKKRLSGARGETEFVE
ncbi:MAG: protein kinase [Planctomycetota bacterium]|jgi:serine/threonine-protein kinase|nr:protein kinase [Planctomycetota bacterium]MDP7247984.1 protein kinase [Planctomycetota bacterium]